MTQLNDPLVQPTSDDAVRTRQRRLRMAIWGILGPISGALASFAGMSIAAEATRGCQGWFCGLEEMLVGGLVGYGVGATAIASLGAIFSQHRGDQGNRGRYSVAGAIIIPVLCIVAVAFTAALY